MDKNSTMPLPHEEESSGTLFRIAPRMYAPADPMLSEHHLHELERPLYHLCRGMLGSADDAEDAVQETFLRALRTRAGFRGTASLRTWLTRIAINVCLEWRRSPGSRVESGDFALRMVAVASPENGILQNLRILEALATLSARQRAVFLLKEWEGWSVAEIAVNLRCTQRRIYYELKLAHSSLAEWRKQEAEENGR